MAGPESEVRRVPPAEYSASLDRADTTRNCITMPVVFGSARSKSASGAPPPNGSSEARFSRMISVPTGTAVKSTITSARSAGAMSRRSSLIGAPRNPPSPPICQKCSPSRESRRLRNRESQPFSNRNRYRRCSTSRYGQVRPFTIIVFPKNSGFQIGDTSLAPLQPASGMNGIWSWPTARSSKNARLFG